MLNVDKLIKGLKAELRMLKQEYSKTKDERIKERIEIYENSIKSLRESQKS